MAHLPEVAAQRPPGGPAASHRDVRRALGWAALTLLLLAQVVALYVVGGDAARPPFPGADKLGHALLFGAPAAVGVLLGRRWVLWLVVGHALVSEPVQGWLTPHRVGEIGDLAADIVGIVLGVVLAGAALRRRAR